MKRFLWAFLVVLIPAMALGADLVPVSRNIEKISGSTYRIYTAPKYYKDVSGLRAIDPAHVENVLEDDGFYLKRSRGVVSVAACTNGQDMVFKTDDGASILSMALDSITFEGVSQPLSLTGTVSADGATTTMPDFLARSTGTRTRLLVPGNGNQGFRITFTIITDLEAVRVGDEYHFRDATEKVIFRLAAPRLVDTSTFEPLLGDAPGFPLAGAVTHTLTDNEDGTFTYVKESGPGFASLSLPASYLIDADVVYGEASDGWVGLDYSGGWIDAIAETTGSGSGQNDASSTVGTFALYYGGISYVYRSFFAFDLSAISGTVTACDFYIRSLRNSNLTESTTNVSVFQGTQGTSLAADDLHAFTGSEFGSCAWVNTTGTWNTISLNASGVSYISGMVGDTAYLCAREKDHDVAESNPGEWFGSGMYYSESTGNEPYLEITMAAPAVTSSPIIFCE